MCVRFVRGLLLALCLSSAFADEPLTRYFIDPGLRGPEISTIVAAFNTGLFKTPRSEVAMQVRDGFIISPLFALGVIGGFIPYVESATSSLHGTLVIVKYLNPRRVVTTQPQYLVVPVEQMVSVMYSPQAIPQSSIVSTFPPTFFPLYNIDPAVRAADLEDVFHTLNTSPTFKTRFSSVGIFTTLSGPYDPAIVGGFIPDVQKIVVSGAFLTIEYLPLSSGGRTFDQTKAVILVTAEQVIQLVYYANVISSPNGIR